MKRSMNSNSTGRNFNPKKNNVDNGFALIATLSLMVLLLVLALGVLSLSTVELRSTRSTDTIQQARSNARLGLMIALGELQEASGPDQRITATASILGDSDNLYSSSITPVDGRKHWTGVWKSDTEDPDAGDTPSYDPSNPDERSFITWLVSSPNRSTVSELDEVQNVPAGADNFVTIFEGLTVSENVTVPKVSLTEGSKDLGSYAYWVEDQGLKADLSWNEGEFTDTVRKQAARLSASPGPGYETLEGPFTGNVAYPIQRGSLWIDDMDKALSTKDVPLVVGAPADAEWLREKRHDIALGSLGVMVDVQHGGLRRDLSLAFEMDGEEEAEDATLFNQQFGEFVSEIANADDLTPPGKSTGMPVYERFLYRDQQSFTGPFSEDITGASSVLRGPNWWALRDYANLYKKLEGAAGSYALEARPYFPNRATEGKSYDSRFRNNAGDQWDRERTGNDYIYRPARPAYAPVMLGTVGLVSLGVKDGNYAVVIDSLYYLWNPYNRRLKFESFAFDTSALDGAYLLEVTDSGGEIKKYYSAMAALVSNNPADDGNKPFISLLEPDTGETEITMEPGEVMVVTAGAGTDHQARTGYFNDGNGGTNLSSSGVFMSNLSLNGDSNTPVTVPAMGTTYEFSFYKSISGNNNNIIHNWRTAIPNSGTTPAEIASSWNSVVNDVQYYATQSAGSGSLDEELLSDGVNITASSSDVSQIDGTPTPPPSEKDLPVGMFLTLMKPANFEGASYTSDTTYPSEIFARFNPAPMSSQRDHFRESILNQQYAIVRDTANALQSDYGLSFSGAGRTAFWGTSFDGNSAGLSSVPMTNIPDSPLISLAQFSHAHLSFSYAEPFQAVGNSWSHPYIPTASIYGAIVYSPRANSSGKFAGDLSWQLNDVLFDRYYLSGIAADFGSSSSGGTLKDTLDDFFEVEEGSDYRTAQVNPVLRPYFPPGKSATEIVTELNPDAPDNATDGYKKIGAYSLINGQFNVNSTSVAAWEVFLNGNRSLEIVDAQGNSDAEVGSPFPSSPSPADPSLTDAHWSGFSRLSTSEVRELAERIVEQVKLRGPFMSLSHFINRRVDDSNTFSSPETCFSGAIQTAINGTSPNINQDIRDNAGGTEPDYASRNRLRYYKGNVIADDRKTTTGIAGDITQADILLPLAPRLSARSDTFRIRSYGEVRSADGSEVIAQATCEAIVQRVPEYMDTTTDPSDNEPWDEQASATNFNAINKKYGRRFKIMEFRWLSMDEL